jgi:predicted nucleic acid-binding protein
MNDALIAASLREDGSTLITHNTEDFKLLAKVERFRFLEPWPKAL